jgi:hypothetical protein
LIKILHGFDVSLFEFLEATGYQFVKKSSDNMLGDAGIEPASVAVAA